MDAKATASSSRFMPQSQEDKVQFQLEAFIFQEGNSPSVCTECLIILLSFPVCSGFVIDYLWCLLQIYVTCILKATLASAPSDALRKSCSFANGYVHVGLRIR